MKQAIRSHVKMRLFVYGIIVVLSTIYFPLKLAFPRVGFGYLGLFTLPVLAYISGSLESINPALGPALAYPVLLIYSALLFLPVLGALLFRGKKAMAAFVILQIAFLVAHLLFVIAPLLRGFA